MLGIARPYLILGAVAASLAVLGGMYLKGRSDGRAAVMAKLQADRVKILKNNQEITNEVLNSDDDGLCLLLGGCGLPDDNGE